MPVVASVNTVEPTIQKKLIHSYPEVLNYLLKKLANDLAIAEKDSAILRYIQLANMTPMQCAEDLYAKTFKVAEINCESMLNNVFIEEVDSSICHGLREQWATNPHANVTYIPFKAQSLLATQKDTVKQPTSGNQTAAAKLFSRRNCNEHSANAVDAGW